MPCSRSLQTYVVAPAEPGVALKNVARLLKSVRCFLMLTLDRVIDSYINERVGLCLEHMKLSCYLQPFLIVLESSFVILEFSVHPPYAIWHAWKPEPITISSRNFDSLFECGNTL